MPIAFAALTLGLWIAYSGFKGISLIDVLSGKTGDTLDPASKPTANFALPTTGSDLGGGEFQGTTDITTSGGAKGIVDSAAGIAAKISPQLIVVSGYRPGSRTTSGSISDHSANDSRQAARDIGKKGVDAINGPPSKELDTASVAIGKAFGRNYTAGQVIDADSFNWNGYRIQVIWRTPKYGGHMGHIHVGARKL
jgi:hypothetical protein